MNGLKNGLYDGLLNGQANGLFDGLNNGLHNGLFNNEILFDNDVIKFINAIGTLSDQQINSINYLVYQLKLFKIWNKCYAIYPFIGGTASSHKFNLKNPLDINSAFRLTFNGGWTHSINGATPNGSNAFANTYLIPNNIMIPNSKSLSYYSRSSGFVSTFDTEIGSRVQNTSILEISIRQSNNNSYLAVGGTNAIKTISNTNGQGYYIGTRINDTITNFYKNGTLVSTGDSNLWTSSQVTNSIYIGATNDGSFYYYSNKQCAFAHIGEGLNQNEIYSLNNIIQNYQTMLGRKV